jgi:hypothetical protein
VDKLSFIVEMTKALAWPVVVGTIALFARKPVALLIEGLRLQKLKGAGWEFEFGKLEAKVQEHVAELPAPQNAVPALPAPAPISNAEAMGVIVTNWVGLERTVLDAARERFGERAEKSFRQAVGQLLQAKAITPATADALRGLQQMRNLAVHAPDDKALAERAPHFVTLSEAMRWSLESELKKGAKP